MNRASRETISPPGPEQEKPAHRLFVPILEVLPPEEPCVTQRQPQLTSPMPPTLSS